MAERYAGARVSCARIAKVEECQASVTQARRSISGREKNLVQQSCKLTPVQYAPDLLSVLGLVPTLTSEIRCDQPLDGRRKWQHKDTSLSWFWPEGRMSSRLRMCTVLPCSKGACRGGLPARWDRRRSLQVPAMMIEAKCQYQVM
jgi:hypothetical protein